MNRVLGLRGSGDLGATELADGQIFQTISVGDVARRSQTLVNAGLFTGILQNVHAGADNAISNVDPYLVPAGNVIAPYPTPVPLEFDVWLLSATVERVGGTNTLAAYLQLNYNAQGWGQDEAAAPVVASADQIIAFWDTVILNGTIEIVQLAGSDQPEAFLNRRIPRGCLLQFFSAAGAAATYRMHLNMALFPIALGQDGAF